MSSLLVCLLPHPHPPPASPPPQILMSVKKARCVLIHKSAGTRLAVTSAAASLATEAMGLTARVSREHGHSCAVTHVHTHSVM